jgi:hypothetical protein
MLTLPVKVKSEGGASAAKAEAVTVANAAAKMVLFKVHIENSLCKKIATLRKLI